jgi:hypothetical protein
MTQLGMDFAPDLTAPPRASATDPWTSLAAAREVTDTGQAATEAAEVLAALRRFPGSTSRELAVFSKIDRYTVARRLPELRHQGRAENGAPRRCTSSGKWAMTWTATEGRTGR